MLPVLTLLFPNPDLLWHFLNSILCILRIILLLCTRVLRGYKLWNFFLLLSKIMLFSWYRTLQSFQKLSFADRGSFARRLDVRRFKIQSSWRTICSKWRRQSPKSKSSTQFTSVMRSCISASCWWRNSSRFWKSIWRKIRFVSSIATQIQCRWLWQAIWMTLWKIIYATNGSRRNGNGSFKTTKIHGKRGNPALWKKSGVRRMAECLRKYFECQKFYDLILSLWFQQFLNNIIIYFTIFQSLSEIIQGCLLWPDCKREEGCNQSG